jgi:glycosyltransferase involved in cell wall biosynthesis
LRVFHITPFLTTRHTCDLIQERWWSETLTKPLTPPGIPHDWLQRHYRYVWDIYHSRGERLHYGWVWEAPALWQLLDQILVPGAYDAIWSGNDTLAFYLQSGRYDHTPVLISPTDSMHLQYWRQIRHEKISGRKIRLIIKWLLYTIYQLRVMNKFPYWTMTSERDASNMKHLSPGCEIRVIPYGVDVEYFKPPSWISRNPFSVIFLGTLGDSSPNEIAVKWFLHNVWPDIINRNHQAEFTIVGRNPSRSLLVLSNQFANVKITGYVEDVRPYLWRAGIAVLPMQSGAGIKNKLLEAWAAGCAVVTTHLGVEGVRHALQGENVLICNDAKSMAETLIELMSKPFRQQQLGDAGRETVQQFYTWEAIASQLEVYLMEIVNSYKARG